MTDFEHGLIEAFTNVYTGTQMRGYFFHFGQCLWRKIQSLPKIRQKYPNNADFALKIKQLMALAFVSVSDVAKFDELMSQQFFVDNGELLIHLSLPKTNNNIEVWPRAFSSLLAVSPTIWRLIEGLKKEQQLTELKVNQFIAGQEPPAKKKKYRDVARRIQNLLMTNVIWMST
ncbi:hypothetical protein QTP88_012853 [Uroleucon formosanum]